MAKRFIYNLDQHLNINDVVYIRLKDDNGECVISAAKYLGWYTEVNRGGCLVLVNYSFQLPNGRIHSVYADSLSVYDSIEDAINDYNKYITRTTLMELLGLVSNGFTWMRNCIGAMEISKVMYKWNGYQAEAVSKCYYEFDFCRDADGITYKLREKKHDTATYYNTKEECLDKNKVKVMTF